MRENEAQGGKMGSLEQWSSPSPDTQLLPWVLRSEVLGPSASAFLPSSWAEQRLGG